MDKPASVYLQVNDLDQKLKQLILPVDIDCVRDLDNGMSILFKCIVGDKDERLRVHV